MARGAYLKVMKSAHKLKVQFQSRAFYTFQQATYACTVHIPTCTIMILDP